MAAIVLGGCTVYPEDVQQIVCAQHYINDGFLEQPDVLWVDPKLTKLGY